MSHVKLPNWAGPVMVGATFVGLFWLERRHSLRSVKPEPDWRRVPRNMVLAALVAAEVRVCERPLVEPVSRWVARRRIGLLPRLGLSPGVEKLLSLLLLDYSLYWWHILLHRAPLLWRSHIVHHSDLVLDTTTALRFHTAEFFASIPWRLAQVVVIGVPPQTLALWQRLTVVEVLFHHSNVRLPLIWERWLSRFVMTPRLHGIHHSVVTEQTDSNYSSGLTVWDVLHKTLKKDVSQGEIEIGVPAYHDPQELQLPDLLALPFRRQRPTWCWQRETTTDQAETSEE